MDDSDDRGPFIYIHVLPIKTGGGYFREIVPASSLNKFDFDKYQNDRKIRKEYKERRFKIKYGGQKRKCYLLYASG